MLAAQQSNNPYMMGNSYNDSRSLKDSKSSAAAYTSQDGAPIYTPAANYSQQREYETQAFEYSSASASASSSSSQYSPPTFNRNPFSQSARLPASMVPGPLQLPFAVPQIAAGASAPFLRGYSHELQAAGIAQTDFIAFMDAVNKSIIPNPELQITAKAVGIAGWFVPVLPAALALAGVQIVSKIGGAVQVKGATKRVIQTAQRNLFGPAGLEVKLQSAEQLNQSLGFYGTPKTPNMIPGESQMNPALRLQQYESLICPLSMALPPAQSHGRQDPIAQLGQWGTNRSQKKAERKAQKDAMKGKMKKAGKIEQSLLWLVVTNSPNGRVSSGMSSGGLIHEYEEAMARRGDDDDYSEVSQDRKDRY